jgi:hypothetical protein
MKQQQQTQKLSFKSLRGHLCWIQENYFLDFPQFKSLIDPIVDRFEKIYTTRGPVAAAEEMKASRLLLTRWKSGHPLSGSVGAPLSKIDGLPKVLPLWFRRSIKDDPTHDKFKWALTLLSISRIIMGGKPLDFKSITDPSEATKLPETSEIALALRSLGLKPMPKKPEWKGFHWTSAAGPNGMAIAQAITDLGYLPEWLKEDLQHIGGDKFRRALAMAEKFADYYPALNSWFSSKSLLPDVPRTKFIRRIAIKADSEAKSRPFAILDYWSQAALTPLHDSLYDILRNLPQDCTFDQQKGVNGMRKFSKSKIYSLDLKSATDRFPIEIQKRVLTWLIDSDFADSWVRIMVKEPFTFEGHDLSFNTGQPLGAKSSWAMFTLAHHVVMAIAASRVGSPLSNYYILGDDVVIRTKKLANSYLGIMKEIGVSISEAKSHEAKGFFEFAKTWIFKDQHVSGFPVKGLHTTIHQYQQLVPVLLDVAPLRGYPLPFIEGRLNSFVKSITRLMTPYERLQNNLTHKMELAIAFCLGCREDLAYQSKFVEMADPDHVRPLNNPNITFLTNVMKVVQVEKEREVLKLRKFCRSTVEKTQPIFSSMYSLSQGRGNFFFSETGKKTFMFTKEYEIKMMGTITGVDSLGFNPAVSISIPVLGALEREYDELRNDLSILSTKEPKIFWEKFKSWDLKPFPQLKGLKPDRIKTRSQALTSLSLKSAKLIRNEGVNSRIFNKEVTSVSAGV